MLNFILMTLSFTVALLVASGVVFVIMLQPKVIEWYMNKAFKMMNKINYEKIAENLICEDEEL